MAKSRCTASTQFVLANLTPQIAKKCWLHSRSFDSVHHCDNFFHLRVFKLFEALTQTFACNTPSTDPNQTRLVAEVAFAAPVLNLHSSGLAVTMCECLPHPLLPWSRGQAFREHQCSAARTPLPRAASSGLRQTEEAMGTVNQRSCSTVGLMEARWPLGVKSLRWRLHQKSLCAKINRALSIPPLFWWNRGKVAWPRL